MKTYLLPDKSKESKRKTAVVKKSLNPVFSKTLTVFSVPLVKLLMTIHQFTCVVQTQEGRGELEMVVGSCIRLGSVWFQHVPWGSSN